MKIGISIALILVVNICSKSYCDVLFNKNLMAKKNTFLVVVRSEPSRPHAQGKGFCGAGEEIFMEVRLAKKKKPLFSKLIESCLESILLEPTEHANYGGETSETIQKLINVDEKNLKIEWQMSKSEKVIKANLELKSGQAQYSEK
jgi:hypothetical protein